MFRKESAVWRCVGRQEMVMVMAIFNHMQYLHHIDYLLDFRWLGVNGILYLCGSVIFKDSILTFPPIV